MRIVGHLPSRESTSVGRPDGSRSEQFNTIHYAAMASCKIGVLLFNLVPYVAALVVVR